MTTPAPAIDAGALVRTGVEALRRGDARTAREAFERILAAGTGGADACLGLAHACVRLEDYPGARAAVDRALALEPANTRALMLKGDYLAHEGDERAASSFYLAAVKSAPPADRLPPELRAEVARAQRMCEHYAAKFEATLRAGVLAGGVEQRPSAARFVHSLDILFGRRKIYYQEPRYYYFPELPQVQFYPREAFPWMDRVEAATAEIRDEFRQVFEDPSRFAPYVQGDPRRPPNEQRGMLDNPDWSAFYLWREGRIIPENAARCPATMRTLAEVPLSRVPSRSPSVLFSVLRPGARIPPHNGMVNTRLICHLPLVVPPDCGLRVGNETRTPVEGRAWVFDDTVEHEAWNLSDRVRAILLFEVWRPELSEEECRLVTALFEAIDAHAGERVAWQI
jgi:aspartyl/asparaginyl beta-hydroxylase (cupin superfamily)